MIIDILTLFPSMFEGPFDTSMLKKAKDKGLVEINIRNLRDWANDKHKTVDDRPFGGGKGMVLRVDVIHRALQTLKSKIQNSNSKSNSKLEKIDNEKNKPDSKLQVTILLSPQGKVFDQKKAKELSNMEHIILIAGHYEGFDERIAENLVDEEISIGDYILTGGEIPVMVLVDSIVRLIPGVLDEDATFNESFSHPKLLDHPVYTRPDKYLQWKVPKVLLSGNHKDIEVWRKNASLEKTKKVRPDLIKTD